MNGFWYLVFVALGIAVASLTMMIVSDVKYKKYDRICHEARYNSEEYKLANRKRMVWADWDFPTKVVFGVSLGVTIILALVAWLNPLTSKKQVAYFRQQSAYVEMAVVNGTDLENIAITKTVIEQNQWLADAKANLETYGIFSGYYGSDLNELEPIIIER